jgi:predicted DNA-binding transcriptional regulator AlpA
MTPRNCAGARRSSLPEGVLPRGLSRVQTAEYIGVSASTLDRMVADGIMPKPIRIYGRVIWDVRAIDASFDALDSGPTEDDDDPWRDMAP